MNSFEMTHFGRRALILPVLLMLTGAVVDRNPAPLTARDVVSQIRQHVTCAWSDETVDTFKGGNPDTEVTGIATTFLATLDVLKRAKAQGLNLIITHEPTFYNHRDELDYYGENKMVAAKKKFIEDNHLVVWRFHDHWHRTSPDGIYVGFENKLDWHKSRIGDRPPLYRIPPITLKAFCASMRKTFHTETIRVVGDPNMQFTNVALVLGAAGSVSQVSALENDDVEVLMVGETHQWETVEYTRDAIASGKKKALVLLGHANSEEAGMEYCAQWLKGFIKDVPVEFVPAGDPFWAP